MAAIRVGFELTPIEVTAEVSQPALSLAREMDLGSGAKFDGVTTLAASTATTSATLWTAANHATAATSRSCNLAVVVVDPAQALADDTAEVGVFATYTVYNATTVTNTTVVYLQATPGCPLPIPGEARKSDDTRLFLTKIEARNRNAFTVNVRTQVWS